MTFACWAFRIAGIYGLLLLIPQPFFERQIGRDRPPPMAHPEYFYGFLGVAIAWQVAFLVIASDPARHRPMMIPAMIEKFSFAAAAVALFALGRITALVLAFGLIDGLLGLTFAVAYGLVGGPRGVATP